MQWVGFDTGTDRDGALRGMNFLRAQLLVLVTLFTVAVFIGIFFLVRANLYGTLLTQARSYLDLVVDTRDWNAKHDGVWVLKTDGIQTNPWLAQIGVDADLETTSGTTLTLRNHAAMIREISDLTLQRNGVSFRLTSQRPLNPANAPDVWEARALKSFTTAASDFYGIDVMHGTRYYRYAQALIIDNSCLNCHKSQGYKIGDIYGAVTISIPAENTDAQLQRDAVILGALGALTVGLAVAVVSGLVTRMGRRVDEVNRQLEEAAITDPLTGAPNRGGTLLRLEQEFGRSRRLGEPLSVIAIDLDHFKRINDTHGHPAGDLALRGFVERVSGAVRSYDLLGRVGGEEFLVVAPGTDLETATNLAERILDDVREAPFDIGVAVRITASAGVATLETDDRITDDLLVRADRALYRSKEAGRDRVSVIRTTDPDQ